MAENVSIDKLDLEVTTSSGKAEQGLGDLIAKLNRLDDALGRISMPSRAKELFNELKGYSRIKGIDDINQQLSTLRKRLDSLENVQGLRRVNLQLRQLRDNLGQTVSVDDFSELSRRLDDIGSRLAHMPTSTALVVADTQAARLTEGVKATSTALVVADTHAVQLASSLKSASDSGSFTRINREVSLLSANLRTAEIQAQHIPINFERLERSAAFENLADTDFTPVNEDLRQMGTQLNNVGRASRSVSTTWIDDYLKLSVLIGVGRRVFDTLSGMVTLSNDYVENVNLFTLSMGEYAKEAAVYAATVADVMGIDPSQWLQTQGIIQTLATGFEIGAENAAKMSRNLTQLTYDISSFRNLDVDEAADKIRSAISGEIEPARNLGYDLSQARLQQIAAARGIEKDVDAMTQAEKAQLRYIALMTQVTQVQGDMARTLESPANQLRIFNAQLTQAGRAIGNIFIPALNAVLPYATATLVVIRELANEIAALAGFELPEVDYSGVTGADELVGTLEEADSTANKLKRTLLGFDEINLMNGGLADASAGGLGINFGELPDYDFLGEATQNRVNEIAADIKSKIYPTFEWIRDNFDEIKTSAAVIGTAILGWQLSSFLPGSLTSLTASLNNVKASAGRVKTALGLTGLLGGMVVLDSATEDLADALYSGDRGSLAFSLFELVAGGAGISAGGYAIGGPIGAVIGALAALGVAIKSVKDKEEEYAKSVVLEEYFSENGFRIGAYTEQLSELFKDYDRYIEDQTLLNTQLDAAADELKDASVEVGTLLTVLSQRESIDSSDIETLQDRFSKLYTAFNSFSTINFELLFSGMSAAINANFGKEATEKIAGMTLQLQNLKNEIGVKTEESQQHVNEILSSAAENGGELTAEQLRILKEEYAKIAYASLEETQAETDLHNLINNLKRDLSSGEWGGDPSVVLSDLAELNSQFDTTVSGFWNSAEAQSRALDQTKRMAENLGIDTSGINWDDFNAVFMATAQKQVDEVAEVYNAVLDVLYEKFLSDRNEAYKTNKDLLANSVGARYEYLFNAQGRSYDEVVRDLAMERADDIFGDIIERLKKLRINTSSGSSIGYSLSDGTFLPTAYATGGLPDHGELFIARESGPELVGTMGGRTVVANNDQIVEGISNGVYNAMSRAMAGSGGNWTIQIIDTDGRVTGETIITAAQRKNRRDGRTTIPIGV